MNYQCSLCGDMVAGDVLSYKEHTETHIVELIRQKHPDWADESGVCPKCLEYFRNQMKGTEGA